jgi:uncharacterized protein (DUF697 family)
MTDKNLIPQETQSSSTGLRLADRLLDRIGKVIDETDEKAAANRVVAMRAAHPNEPLDKLADRLTLAKCRETALIGGATSAAAIIPGVGTFASLTLGIAADFGITFKLQAELVLEIATLYGYAMNPPEKRRVVMLITGLSAGATTLAHRAGQSISRRVTARVGSKAVTTVLPVVGVAASASTNAILTYAIGQRAKAYFSLGPEAMGNWRLSAQAITGLNRQLLAKGGQALQAVGETAVSGANKVRTTITKRRRKPAALEAGE